MLYAVCKSEHEEKYVDFCLSDVYRRTHTHSTAKVYTDRAVPQPHVKKSRLFSKEKSVFEPSRFDFKLSEEAKAMCQLEENLAVTTKQNNLDNCPRLPSDTKSNLDQHQTWRGSGGKMV